MFRAFLRQWHVFGCTMYAVQAMTCCGQKNKRFSYHLSAGHHHGWHLQVARPIGSVVEKSIVCVSWIFAMAAVLSCASIDAESTHRQLVVNCGMSGEKQQVLSLKRGPL